MNERRTHTHRFFVWLSAWLRSLDTSSRVVALGAAAWVVVGAGFYIAGTSREEMMNAGFLTYIVVVVVLGLAVLVRRKLHVSPAHRTQPSVSLNWIPLVASVVMLLMAVGGDWPYGFYQLLRMVVCGAGIYVVIQTSKHLSYWPWIMGGIAVLFNPLLPVSFTREVWRPIDFAVAVIFVIALVQLRQRK